MIKFHFLILIKRFIIYYFCLAFKRKVKFKYTTFERKKLMSCPKTLFRKKNNRREAQYNIHLRKKNNKNLIFN
jgi:hypothetical protein